MEIEREGIWLLGAVFAASAAFVFGLWDGRTTAEAEQARIMRWANLPISCERRLEKAAQDISDTRDAAAETSNQ